MVVKNPGKMSRMHWDDGVQERFTNAKENCGQCWRWEKPGFGRKKQKYI